ncbi:hypothetical protein G7077_11070 [Sphingomonas piscis]|uniref:General stress protein 17M-like domain-containing protein n=1 Tax=Sphingomonas piscis TaxID=2714943 RepID=A0A6G7YRJ7_9SPHN|nr:general stress protein [Sphingomonas piscis]QIK79363.1 hypothetical protein G7077_11070 [Sphingomonas piscis]
MSDRIASAVFDSRDEAQRAIEELRSAGVDESAISVVGQQGEESSEHVGDGEDDSAGEKTGSFISKTAAGAGVGALLGVAALAIPGVGPLAAAGAIASSAIPGAALTGTAIGAAAGGVGSLLTDHGVSDEDASYYEEHINRGGIFVSVDTDRAGVGAETARDIIYRAGGHSSSRTRETATTY